MNTTWVTPLVTVVLEKYNYHLGRFDVFRNSDKAYLGPIFPPDIDTEALLAADLDEGACPIADHWEDGDGNTCHIDGWFEGDIRNHTFSIE